MQGSGCQCFQHLFFANLATRGGCEGSGRLPGLQAFYLTRYAFVYTIEYAWVESMELLISKAVAKKLKEKHAVSPQEVVQCFRHKTGKYAYDTREQHQTNPPTLWFIAETDQGRRLKVVFLRYSKDEFVLKSAFPPNAEEERLYQMYKDRG